MPDNPSRYGDIGTPERHLRKEIVISDIEGQPRAKARKCSPIEEMYNRKTLNAVQYSAGKKLYESYYIMWIGKKNCEYREPVDGGGQKTGFTERQMIAKEQYDLGIKAAGVHKEIVESVVVMEHYISAIVKHRYTRKKMLERLREALSDIARVYGYI